MKEQIKELLVTIMDREPLKFKAVFESVMREKVTQVVAAKKEALAPTVFNKKD